MPLPTRKAVLRVLAIAAILSAFCLSQAIAAPTGADAIYNSTDYGPTIVPASFNDSRGTITTVVLEAVQQDQNWKAYVGNVTGVLTLDDANGFTIYDWSLTGVTITGEVYAVRNSSAVFAGVQCANITNILAEQAFNNMTTTQVDNINRTFNYTLHEAFYVGATPVANSTCRTAFTYINNSRQPAVSEASPFQEVLLQDVASNVLYVTIIENNVAGFDNRPYDFQMLVAESEVKAAPTTYYFFTEIAS